MAAMGYPAPGEIEDDNNDEDDLEIVKPPLRYATSGNSSPPTRLQMTDCHFDWQTDFCRLTYMIDSLTEGLIVTLIDGLVIDMCWYLWYMMSEWLVYLQCDMDSRG